MFPNLHRSLTWQAQTACPAPQKPLKQLTLRPRYIPEFCQISYMRPCLLKRASRAKKITLLIGTLRNLIPRIADSRVISLTTPGKLVTFIYKGLAIQDRCFQSSIPGGQEHKRNGGLGARLVLPAQGASRKATRGLANEAFRACC